MIYSGKIKNINHIVASDPGYESKVWCRYEKNNLDLKDWDIDISLRDFYDVIDGYEISGTDIRIMLHPHNVEAQIYGNSISYPGKFNTNSFTLGMDTASMSIGTNSTADIIIAERDTWQPLTCLRTLTDGEFGCAIEGTNGDELGFIYISGFLDSDTGYSHDELLEYFKKNLEIENLSPILTINNVEIETLLVEPDGIDVSLATWFDVDEKFGTHVNGEDGHWVNFYALYNPDADTITFRYAVDTPEKITDYDYSPSIYEEALVKKMINDYCLKEENATALELYESQFQDMGGMDQ